MNLDRLISEAAFATHGKYPWLDKIAVFCARELIVILAIISTVSVYRHGASIQDHGVWAVLWPVLVVGTLIVVSWGIATLLELIFRRPRPYTALGKKPLDSFWTPTPSFPSSHACISFALASIWLVIFPKSIEETIGMMFVAVLVAAARVYVGVHYTSDVIVGAIFGSVIGSFGLFVFMVSHFT